MDVGITAEEVVVDEAEVVVAEEGDVDVAEEGTGTQIVTDTIIRKLHRLFLKRTRYLSSDYSLYLFPSSKRGKCRVGNTI